MNAPVRKPLAAEQEVRASNAAARSAAFILSAALELDIHVGTDGSEIVLLAPMRVPRETRRWFEIQLDQYRREIIAIIEAENAGRRS